MHAEQIQHTSVSLASVAPQMEETKHRLLEQLAKLDGGRQNLASLKESLESLHQVGTKAGNQAIELENVLNGLSGGRDNLAVFQSGLQDQLNVLNVRLKDLVHINTDLQDLTEQASVSRSQVLEQVQEANNQMEVVVKVGKLLADINTDEIETSTKIFAESLQNIVQLQEVLLGMSEATKLAEKIGLSYQVTLLNQGLERLKNMISEVSNFQENVVQLQKFWTETDLHKLVSQNQAWLKLIRSPFHNGIPQIKDAPKRPVKSQLVGDIQQPANELGSEIILEDIEAQA